MTAAGTGMPGVLKLVVQAFLEEDHYKRLYTLLAEQVTIRVAGAGGVGATCNGDYCAVGMHGGKPKYQKVDGRSIIFYTSSGWAISHQDDTSAWYYKHLDVKAAVPPVDQWTTDGYSNGDADPAPSISHVQDWPSWRNYHSLTAAMKLMEAHGVKIDKAEEDRLLQYDESRTIDVLVSKMPQQSREQFEHFFLQLSFIASTTKRLREALQEGDHQTTADAMESAENIGVLPHMLKMMVVQAGSEVKRREGLRDRWLANQVDKMKPLLEAQAGRMEIQKQLAQVKQQIGDYQVSAKSKSEKMLLQMAQGNDANLLGTVAKEWFKYFKNEKLEHEISQEYEQQLASVKQKIMDFRSKHLANARSAMEKNFAGTQEALLLASFEAFKDNLTEEKRKKEGGETLKAHEERLKAFNAAARANAQRAMATMNTGNDAFLVEAVFNEWVVVLVEYKKEKELNDAVRESEKRMKEMLKQQNQGAMDLVKKMGAQSETGLLTSFFKEWREVVDDIKTEGAVQEQLNQKASQLANMASRTKGTAANTSERMSQLQDQQILLFCFCTWKRDCQVERVKKYGRDRNKKREKELMGVKSLFRDFASRLDRTLDQDNTPRVEDKGGAKPKRESPPQPRSPQPP